MTVQDTSIEGFTLRVEKRFVQRVRGDYEWMLTLLDERTQVHPQWMCTEANGDAKIGVSRGKDATPQEGVKRSWVFWSSVPKDAGSSVSGIALGGMLLLIVAMICLPGIGDDLGTAPWVRSFLRDGLRHLGMSVRQFLNS
ncbi:hypothetical protein [Rosistilla carotiformis]|uniref:hypothetical protein n=1 Tax=Rosistilla carotiformis TaxID=2528017 RepID=UPI00119ED7EC|nr:hypothetical protein [Rosistilla carotiformis]